jgi:hypothetical protein
VYVTGRSQQLLDEAIAHWNLPLPELAVGDVGTTILEPTDHGWQPLASWWNEIAPAWNELQASELHRHIGDQPELTLQEQERQSRFKLSYYAPSDLDWKPVCARVHEQLMSLGVRASLIWSVDETNDVGLLDVLPESATKLHAVRFVGRRLGIHESRTVFAGDSGNDLPALTSGLNAILVANARSEVRDAAIAGARERGTPERLYVACGDLGMNGNYAAGVLEGLAHFFPETRRWIEQALGSAQP